MKRIRAAGALFLIGSAAAGALALGAAAAPPGPPVVSAPPPAPVVDAAYFAREIQPILQRSCLGCHGVSTQLSHLDLRSRLSALKGGNRGPALSPGSAAKSLLYQFVSGARSPLMPPGGKLPAADLEKLRTWLDGGAPWADGRIETADKPAWWSFQPVREPRLPKLKHAEWARNPVDLFVLQKLREARLSPNPPAPRRVLIRRAYLDLIGLPATPEEVEAFVNDRSPDAWEKVVDRLLASPHYGERWGRHWLDLVRYADSSGYEGDKDRPLAWRYRDYVIRSFNEDKPYDRFLREQLAGDVLADELKSRTGSQSVAPASTAPAPGPDARDCIIATGYLACGTEDFAMVKLPTTRADELDDLVSTTGSVMLGLTIGCARCHDHKYDPIKQTDYYRLQAIFAPTERREIPVPSPEEQRALEAHNAGLEKEAAPLRRQVADLRRKGTDAAIAGGKAKPNDAQILAAPAEAERRQLRTLQEQLKQLEGKMLLPPKALAVTDHARQWEPVHLLVRGDAYHPGPVVQPGFIACLPGGDADVPATAATENTTGRRKALADWIAGDRNPLTDRVWVNRVWRQHFGRGIVNTPSNFGISGELPSHPELLEWLTCRFREGARRLKPIHRLILLSAAYQQSSVIRKPAAGRADPAITDPQNRLYWRMPVRRLEAEAVRDSILAVCGTLNPEMGGPPVYPPVDPSLRADTFQGPNWPEGEDGPKTWRRSVYVKVKRSLLFPLLEVFDCPEITASVAQRNVTTTPNQALTLLNDPLILRQADRFAERLEKEAGKDPRKQVERAYELAFGRSPTPREAQLSLGYLRRRTLSEFCHAVLNLNEFVYAP